MLSTKPSDLPFSFRLKKMGFSVDNAERWEPWSAAKYRAAGGKISILAEYQDTPCTLPVHGYLSLSLYLPSHTLDRGMRIQGYASSKDAFSHKANVRTHTRRVPRFIYSYFYFRDKLSSPAFRPRHLPSSRFPSYCVSPRISLAIREMLVKALGRCGRLSV